MKISEVRQGLKNKSFEQFKHLGFKKNQYGISKKINDYEFYIGFGVVDSDNSFPSGFHYGISSRHTNNILKKIFPSKGFKLNSYSTVYGTKQTKLFDNREYHVLEYNIYIENDIDLLVNDLYDYYTKTAFPFLEKLTDVKKLSVFINSDKVLEESMHLPTTLINGLIISKLANNPNYNELKLKYQNLIQEWTELDNENLINVIMFLDQYTSDELNKMADHE